MSQRVYSLRTAFKKRDCRVLMLSLAQSVHSVSDMSNPRSIFRPSSNAYMHNVLRVAGQSDDIVLVPSMGPVLVRDASTSTLHKLVQTWGKILKLIMNLIRELS